MIVDTFFKMEEECHLFELKTRDIEPVWDILRMHIYLKYHFPQTSQITINEYRSFIDLLRIINGLFKSIWYFMTRPGENFILPCSRYIDDDGLYYDKAAMSVIDSLDDNYFIFEYQSTKREYKYSSANNYKPLFQKIFKSKKCLPESIFSEINNALIKYFGESKVLYPELNHIYQDYLFDVKFYRVILLLKNCKRIFITQNGLQKGLIAAAKTCNLNVYEFQHGSFERDHLGYSYPDCINEKSNIMLPGYLLTFAGYWGSYFNVPIEKIVPIGNDYFVFSSKSEPDKSILIISSIIHGEVLCSLAKQISIKFPDRLIKFKLHTNEYSAYKNYRTELSNFKNIKILKEELDIRYLIDQSELVILINSSVLYEALNQQRKIAILKKVNYLGQENIFNLPNVFLFDSIDELNQIIKCSVQPQNNIFYAPFNKKYFNSEILTYCFTSDIL